MAKIEFVKYEALGNSYIVIDPAKNGLGEPDPKWISRLCSADWGIGSDGVLWGPVDLGDAQAPGLRIFNVDGSEAEKSGNGLRIFSRYLKDIGRVTESFRIRTSAGTVEGKHLASGLTEIGMGEARVVGASLQQSLLVDGRAFDTTRVNVGNPHCVVFGGFASISEIKDIGSLFENHALFQPARTNAQFVEVVSRSEVRIEIWERGSSYTLASGSSSCAVAFACFKRGLVDSRLRVKMPGGDLDVEILDGDRLKMTGPVTWVASGHCLAP
jgi:diaminopimelate epimerase